MIIETNTGTIVNSEMLYKYLQNLVNQFFKILPLKENNEPTLSAYMEMLQAELIGCKHVISMLNDNPSFLSLISILQYLIDFPECTVYEVKREVFKAISICNKLKMVCATPATAEESRS